MRKTRNLTTLMTLALLVGCGDCTCTPVPAAGPARADGPFTVERIVDGDTIHVTTDHGVQKVRFLCIDTPEVSGPHRSQLGDMATTELSRLIGESDVYLARDATHDDVDRHGRLLRHVFLTDETHLNVQMVKLGWSVYYTKYGPCHRYHQAFEDAEQEASRANAGIWSHPEFLRGGYLKNARGD